MRPIERIEPFLQKVDLENLFKNIWKLPLTEEEIKFLVDLIKEKNPELTNIWKKCPDWRFSQLLINSGVIGNYPGFWYHMEESDILERQGYPPEDVNYWGIYYNKDMTPLKEPVYKPLSELESDHLRAIINGGFVKYNKTYRQLMLKVLRKRGERL